MLNFWYSDVVKTVIISIIFVSVFIEFVQYSDKRRPHEHI